MTADTRSGSRSAILGTARTELRTTADCRPPRQHWPCAFPRLALRQLTTRPPRSGRSGGQLPVETGIVVLVQAGRTAEMCGRADRVGG